MIEELKLDEKDGVATLTIHRPQRRNALHAPLWIGIRGVALEIAANAPRALIITGHGEHFCAGMDLNPDNPLLVRLLSEIGGGSEQGLIALIEELKSTFEAITSIGCPVIAAIEGACVGGGLELALACDIRIASETAFFSLPETRFGMVPDLGGTVRLAQTIGVSQAAEIILSAKSVDAPTALGLGLINRVVAAGDALTACESLANAIRENSPAANRGALTVLRAMYQLDEAAALKAETQAGAQALGSREVMEGVQAFMEKRAPRWES
jgi:enoyl-CoA hydratase/carnithine racemase